MEKIIVLHKPTCNTSRKVVRILKEKDANFNTANYYETPFTLTKLNDLLKKMKMKPSAILRKKDKVYKALDFTNKKYTESQIINYMIKNPDLIERPIVQNGKKIFLARPPERISELL